MTDRSAAHVPQRISIAALVIGGLNAGLSTWRRYDALAVFRFGFTAPVGFGGGHPISVLLRLPRVPGSWVIATRTLSVIANGATAGGLRAFRECS